MHFDLSFKDNFLEEAYIKTRNAQLVKSYDRKAWYFCFSIHVLANLAGALRGQEFTHLEVWYTAVQLAHGLVLHCLPSLWLVEWRNTILMAVQALHYCMLLICLPEWPPTTCKQNGWGCFSRYVNFASGILSVLMVATAVPLAFKRFYWIHLFWICLFAQKVAPECCQMLQKTGHQPHVYATWWALDFILGQLPTGMFTGVYNRVSDTWHPFGLLHDPAQGHCLAVVNFAQFVLGYILPVLCLYCIEQHSRKSYLDRINPPAHTHGATAANGEELEPDCLAVPRVVVASWAMLSLLWQCCLLGRSGLLQLLLWG